jgi:hypothetical protein
MFPEFGEQALEVGDNEVSKFIAKLCQGMKNRCKESLRKYLGFKSRQN